ncbi:hypothetical protein [Burkholderia stabilis]|uniref:hypothetical protein n=1 Tax=Burkholderia stabilis TaxID=95485 RepID=UPI0012EA4361|nr:hypothetical protein [Burkholderia stabilis]HDR9490625.1 hypothetical protein [Burkholderia stabilis]HDR9522577.1 hypothetical protein [Burkholderia stabilis]HDR9533099.1 hypothetical protein [Burkholderia stabilis]HDR9537730.1 hypothetical protein [Burkholderia stabilis]HDR9544575.1 hypothetical protein [Burkholderia stabilis]
MAHSELFRTFVNVAAKERSIIKSGYLCGYHFYKIYTFLLFIKQLNTKNPLQLRHDDMSDHFGCSCSLGFTMRARLASRPAGRCPASGLSASLARGRGHPGKKRVSNRLSSDLSGIDTPVFTASAADGAIRANGGRQQAYQT